MAPSNVLPIHGNEKTMNLNTLVLTNIQSSPYFKVHLYELKTYHQVIDEIYYKVNHLEPWEKGSRKTAGQTGMCGGVRGVGAGGIVSSAYCLLYKLYTLKLTRKQLIGLCTHADSPYIRALGLMYIRYTQPPGDLWDWYEPYLDDEEQVDVKAGGGNMMTIGEISQQYLTKLEWYSTLFPRIPVPIQKQIEAHLNGHRAKNWNKAPPQQHVEDEPEKPESRNDGDNLFGEAERVSRRETSRERRPVAPSSRRPDPHERDRLDQERSRPREDRHSYGDVKRDSHADVKRDSHGDAKRDSHRRSRSPRGRRSVSRDRHHSRSGDHIRRSHDRSRHRSRDRSPARTHHRRSKDRKRSSSRSRRRSRSNDDRKRSDDGARHSSKTIDGAKRHCSSRHRSASPNHHHASSGDAFDRDLQKELERVKAAAKDTENGRK